MHGEVSSLTPVCQTCGETAGEWVRCARCLTPQHLECWTFVGHCGTYACGSRRFEPPPSSVVRPDPTLPVATGDAAVEPVLDHRDRVVDFGSRRIVLDILSPLEIALAIPTLCAVSIAIAALIGRLQGSGAAREGLADFFATAMAFTLLWAGTSVYYVLDPTRREVRLCRSFFGILYEVTKATYAEVLRVEIEAVKCFSKSNSWYEYQLRLVLQDGRRLRISDRTSLRALAERYGSRIAQELGRELLGSRSLPPRYPEPTREGAPDTGLVPREGSSTPGPTRHPVSGNALLVMAGALLSVPALALLVFLWLLGAR